MKKLSSRWGVPIIVLGVLLLLSGLRQSILAVAAAVSLAGSSAPMSDFEIGRITGQIVGPVCFIIIAVWMIFTGRKIHKRGKV